MATETTSQRQSRTGKRPVPVPKGVTVTISGGKLSAKGPKGELSRELHPSVTVKQDGDAIVVAPTPASGNGGAQYQGLIRSLVRNMLVGVSEGFKKSMDLHGTGYRAELKGQALTLGLGLSHTVSLELPKEVSGRVEVIDSGGTKRPRLHLESLDKEVLGEVAARIRSYRPPEPYKGKGVRYTGEHVREKAGKAGKAGA